MQTARLEQRDSFVTADGSSIREPAGVPTGNGAVHKLRNPGTEPLVLCCRAPAYPHEDTVLTGA